MTFGHHPRRWQRPVLVGRGRGGQSKCRGRARCGACQFVICWLLPASRLGRLAVSQVLKAAVDHVFPAYAVGVNVVGELPPIHVGEREVVFDLLDGMREGSERSAGEPARPVVSWVRLRAEVHDQDGVLRGANRSLVDDQQHACLSRSGRHSSRSVTARPANAWSSTYVTLASNPSGVTQLIRAFTCSQAARSEKSVRTTGTSAVAGRPVVMPYTLAAPRQRFNSRPTAAEEPIIVGLPLLPSRAYGSSAGGTTAHGPHGPADRAGARVHDLASGWTPRCPQLNVSGSNLASPDPGTEGNDITPAVAIDPSTQSSPHETTLTLPGRHVKKIAIGYLTRHRNVVAIV